VRGGGHSRRTYVRLLVLWRSRSLGVTNFVVGFLVPVEARAVGEAAAVRHRSLHVGAPLVRDETDALTDGRTRGLALGRSGVAFLAGAAAAVRHLCVTVLLGPLQILIFQIRVVRGRKSSAFRHAGRVSVISCTVGRAVVSVSAAACPLPLICRVSRANSAFAFVASVRAVVARMLRRGRSG